MPSTCCVPQTGILQSLIIISFHDESQVLCWSPPQEWEISKTGSTQLVKVEQPTGADHTSTPHDVIRHLHPKPEARGTLSLIW